MIIFNSLTWNENFSSFCSNRRDISARFTVMKFSHIIVILFLHCCRLTWEMKSHQGLTSWNFNLGWNSPPYNWPLRCLTGFWMCLCCVRDNYLSVKFPTQLFLLLSCLWWFKAFSFSTFPIFHKTHTPARWQ